MKITGAKSLMPHAVIAFCLTLVFVGQGLNMVSSIKDFVAHTSNVNCLALGHKSGRVLGTGGDDEKVNLWAVGKENCIMSLSGHTTSVECIRFARIEDRYAPDPKWRH